MSTDKDSVEFRVTYRITDSISTSLPLSKVFTDAKELRQWRTGLASYAVIDKLECRSVSRWENVTDFENVPEWCREVGERWKRKTSL